MTGGSAAGHTHEETVRYRRLDDGTFGVRGPAERLREGQETEVVTSKGEVRTEVVGELVGSYQDTGMAIHRIVRDESSQGAPPPLPEGEIRWTRHSDEWVLIGPEAALAPGSTVSVSKRDGPAEDIEVAEAVAAGDRQLPPGTALARPVRTPPPPKEPRFVSAKGEGGDEWLLAVPKGSVAEGEEIKVTAKSGKEMRVKAGAVVREEAGAEIRSFEHLDSPSSRDGGSGKGSAPAGGDGESFFEE